MNGLIFILISKFQDTISPARKLQQSWVVNLSSIRVANDAKTSPCSSRPSDHPRPARPVCLQPGATPRACFFGPDRLHWHRWQCVGSARRRHACRVPVTYDATATRRYFSPHWSPDGSRLAYCVTDEAASGAGQLLVSWTGEWLPFLISQDVYCKDFPHRSSTGRWMARGSSTPAASPYQGGSPVWDPYYGIWEANIVSGAQVELVPPPLQQPAHRPGPLAGWELDAPVRADLHRRAGRAAHLADGDQQHGELGGSAPTSSPVARAGRRTAARWSSTR